jgi:hypothetical protein
MAKMTAKEKNEIIIDAVAVLIGDYNINRKRAALLLLKAFLPHHILRGILQEDGIHPFDRSDYRVKRWAKEVLKRGRCEKCGATENLEAHHIIKWADYPRGRIDLNNGQCLCHTCHTNEHIDDPSYYMMKAGRSKRK